MKRTVERILAVLSDEQRQTWRQLIGEPFDIDLHLRPEDWSAYNGIHSVRDAARVGVEEERNEFRATAPRG